MPKSWLCSTVRMAEHTLDVHLCTITHELRSTVADLLQRQACNTESTGSSLTRRSYLVGTGLEQLLHSQIHVPLTFGHAVVSTSELGTEGSIKLLTTAIWYLLEIFKLKTINSFRNNAAIANKKLLSLPYFN